MSDGTSNSGGRRAGGRGASSNPMGGKIDEVTGTFDLNDPEFLKNYAIGKNLNSAGEAENFAQLYSYLGNRDNFIALSNKIYMDDDLKFTEVRDAIDGALFVLDEFGAGEQLKRFDVNNQGVMCASFDTIYFTKSYFKKGTKNLDEVMNGGTFHPKNQNAYTTGSHEAGHILGHHLATKTNNFKMMFNHGMETKIIGDCAKKMKSSYKGTGQKAPSIDSMVASVSGYATKNRGEAFAECIADYVANGKNANALSKEVWKHTKKLYN